jgi:hypothetical protein
VFDDWEKFEVCDAGSYATIASVLDGRYVTPELDYTGTGYAMLRARSTSVGAWEKLR